MRIYLIMLVVAHLLAAAADALLPGRGVLVHVLAVDVVLSAVLARLNPPPAP